MRCPYCGFTNVTSTPTGIGLNPVKRYHCWTCQKEWLK